MRTIINLLSRLFGFLGFPIIEIGPQFLARNAAYSLNFDNSVRWYAIPFPKRLSIDSERLGEFGRAAEGKILDGRNRFLACEAAGVEPRFEVYAGGDAIGFVVSANIHRRHLDESQRAMIGAKVTNLKLGSNQFIKVGSSKEEPSISYKRASEMLNVSSMSIQRAKIVLREGDPETIRAIEAGKKKVSGAANALWDKKRKAKPATPPASAKPRNNFGDLTPVRKVTLEELGGPPEHLWGEPFPGDPTGRNYLQVHHDRYGKVQYDHVDVIEARWRGEKAAAVINTIRPALESLRKAIPILDEFSSDDEFALAAASTAVFGRNFEKWAPEFLEIAARIERLWKSYRGPRLVSSNG